MKEIEHTAHWHLSAAVDLYRRVEASLGVAARAYWLTGTELVAAKSKAKHGEWAGMLEASGIPIRTGQRMMQLAREHPDAESLVNAGGITKALAKYDTLTYLTDSAPSCDCTTAADVHAEMIELGMDQHRAWRWLIPDYDLIVGRARDAGYEASGYVTPSTDELAAASAHHAAFAAVGACPDHPPYDFG